MALAVPIAVTFIALGHAGVVAGPHERAGVATRIVFVAGKAKQCRGGDCRPPRDVVRSISPHGGRERELARIRSVVEVSAAEDGKRIAILSKIVAGGGSHATPYTQIYLLAPNGRLEEVFDKRIEGFNATGLGISRDGRRLALSGRGRRMQGFPRQSKIWIVRPDGSMRRLTTGAGADDTPTFSPSGNRVVFSRSNENGSSGATDAELYVVGIGGGPGTRLTNNAVEDVNPVFDPTGRRIAFGQFSDRHGKVRVMRADGKRIQTVAGTGREFPDPDYSPNGRNLAFIGELKPRDFATGIFTVRATGARKTLASKQFPFPVLPQWTRQP